MRHIAPLCRSAWMAAASRFSSDCNTSPVCSPSSGGGVICASLDAILMGLPSAVYCPRAGSSMGSAIWRFMIGAYLNKGMLGQQNIGLGDIRSGERVELATPAAVTDIMGEANTQRRARRIGAIGASDGGVSASGKVNGVSDMPYHMPYRGRTNRIIGDVGNDTHAAAGAQNRRYRRKRRRRQRKRQG